MSAASLLSPLHHRHECGFRFVDSVAVCIDAFCYFRLFGNVHGAVVKFYIVRFAESGCCNDHRIRNAVAVSVRQGDNLSERLIRNMQHAVGTPCEEARLRQSPDIKYFRAESRRHGEGQIIRNLSLEFFRYDHSSRLQCQIADGSHPYRRRLLRRTVDGDQCKNDKERRIFFFHRAPIVECRTISHWYRTEADTESAFEPYRRSSMQIVHHEADRKAQSQRR